MKKLLLLSSLMALPMLGMEKEKKEEKTWGYAVYFDTKDGKPLPEFAESILDAVVEEGRRKPLNCKDARFDNLRWKLIAKYCGFFETNKMSPLLGEAINYFLENNKKVTLKEFLENKLKFLNFYEANEFDFNAIYERESRTETMPPVPDLPEYLVPQPLNRKPVPMPKVLPMSVEESLSTIESTIEECELNEK